MKAELLDTWHIHQRIVLFVLGAVAEEAFTAPMPGSGRSFAEMFANLHDVGIGGALR